MFRISFYTTTTRRLLQLGNSYSFPGEELQEQLMLNAMTVLSASNCFVHVSKDNLPGSRPVIVVKWAKHLRSESSDGLGN